ncbi:MAG: universal stress protein [Bacteroidota bacterium]
MKHILFPTDFSNIAGHALTYAGMLAEKFKARLTLVHVLHSVLEPDNFTRVAPVYSRPEAEHQLQQLQQKLPPSVSSDYRLVEGIEVDSLARLAKEIHGDFFVVGTAGAQHSPEVVAESHTADLIAHTHLPVLAVPFHSALQAPAKIVLALDFDPLDDLSAVAPLVELARQFQSEILFLCVVEKEMASEEKQLSEKARISTLFSGLQFSLHFVVNDHVDEGITRFAEDVQAQLIAIIKRKHGLLASFFHHSVTQKVALYTQTPLLALAEAE